MKNIRATARYPYCVEDARFSGAVEVVETGSDTRTIGVRLCVGDRFVNLPRHRIPEVIAALEAAHAEASKQYQDIIKEMNEHE